MGSYSVFKSYVEQSLGCVLTQEHRFHPKRRWRFDFAIVNKKIAIEVEGGVFTKGRHTRGTGYIKDMEKYNHAVAFGWRVLRFTPNQLMTTECLEIIKAVLEDS